VWTLETAYRVGELAAAAAVVLSLLFVGYEIKQNNRRQVQATTQALVSQYTDKVSLLAQDAELACLYIQ
jgi:hypothetical protein